MTHDLSIHHRPIGSLFPELDPRAAAQYKLRQEQIEFFHEYGYLSGIPVLSDEQVEELRQELARLQDAAS